MSALLSTDEVVRDLARVVSDLKDYAEKGAELTDLDPGQLLMLREAYARVNQVVDELAFVGHAEDFADQSIQEEGAA